TEPRYFNGLKERWHNPKIHIEVLTRESPGESAPDAVLRRLDDFQTTYLLEEEDSLWLVCDRDRQSWKPGMIAAVAQACAQKGYELALNNPCFEIWLLLHFQDVPQQSEDRQRQLFENADGLLKKEVAQHLLPNQGYIDHFEPHTETALARARALDRDR